MLGKFGTQLRVFGTKNAILSLRNWKGTAGQLLSPFFIVLLLFGMQKLSDRILSSEDPDPTATSIGPYPHCESHSRKHPCLTVMYSPNISWVNDLLEQVAYRGGFDFDTDFYGFGNADDLVADNYTMYMHLLNNPNMTQNAIVFTSAYFQDPGVSFTDAQVGYLLFYNGTTNHPHGLEFMRLLDETILSMKANKSDTSISASLNTFPRPKTRVAGYDVVADSGAQWFYVPPMITFFILLTEIVMEKEMRLRLGMRMMGLMDSAYWAIWFVTGAAFIALSSLVLIVSGLIFRFAFFTNANFFAQFFLFFCFGLATNSLAFFLSTLVKTVKSAQTVGYAIILVGFVFQIILGSAYGMLIDMLYADSIATWVKAIRWILTFYPPFDMALCFSNIASFSSNTIDLAEGIIVKGPGYSFSRLWKARVIPDFFDFHIVLPTDAFTLGMLLVNACIYFVLALYLDNVVPGDHGAPKPLYYFLTPKYWGLDTKQSKQDDDVRLDTMTCISQDPDIVGEYERVKDTARNKSPTGVQVLNISKVYPKYFFKKSDDDIKAVDELTLCADEGEILCILGHNGAGKSTLISMLVGLFPPTSGHAFLYGMDISNEMSNIQKILGVCPQYDILWTELTAREHLELFARLKGVRNENIASEVSEKLEMVGLVKAGNLLVGKFSGGMKRRLSVAIAAIGNPSIIFLDEPTTGMDPVNRRSVWELIQRMKQNRTIILTTHAMEEADVLGDKIGIMAHGNLCAIGNGLHLKNRYGTGYRVNVTVTDMEHVSRMIGSVHSFVPDAKIAASNAGNITFGIPLASRERMEPLIQFLEASTVHDGEAAKLQNSENGNHSSGNSPKLVKEWGLSHSTLEDVFLDVTKREHFVYPEESPAETDAVNIPMDNYSSDSRKTIGDDAKPSSRKSYAFRALFRKNFTLQKRQTGTNCCQIFTPILVMLLLILLQVIIRTQVGGELGQKEIVDTFPMPVNFPTNDFPNITSPAFEHSQHGFFMDMLDLNGDFAHINENAEHRKTPLFMKLSETVNELSDLRNIPTYVLPQISTPRKYESVGGKATRNAKDRVGTRERHGGDCLQFFYFSDFSNDNYTAGYLFGNGTKSGLLSHIHTWGCTLHNDSLLHVPYFDQRENVESMTHQVFTILEEYNGLPIDTLRKPPTIYELPDGTVDFQEIDIDALSIEFTFAVNDHINVFYHRPNNFTRAGLPDYVNDTDFVDNSLLIYPAQMELLSMLTNAFRQTVEGPYPEFFIYNLKLVQEMPYSTEPDILGLLEIFGTFLYPIALSLQIPVYLYLVVLEKAEKQREMMAMHGLPVWAYYFSHYSFCIVLYLLVALFFYVAGVGSGMRFFSETSFSTLFMFFASWGLSLVSLSLFLSTFLSSKRAAVVVGYIVALMGTLISLVFAVGIYGDAPLAISTKLPVGFMIWPQFAFVRGMYLLNKACAVEYACYGSLSSVSRHDEFITVLIALFLDAVVYYLIYLYLDCVMPREFGVPKHPLFFLGPLRKKFFTTHEENSSEESEKQKLINTSNPSYDSSYSKENKDVAAERQKVLNGGYSAKAPLVIHNLAKKYPSAEKYSLKDLYLGVNAGECFSLLGENGAGKTTAISLLTGLYPPTAGTAFIAGHDIRSEMDQGRLALGVCPQFNVLWDSLTVEEHLLFYTRLKGVAPSNEKEHVKMWLQELGLGFAKDRKSSDLSGGMKRRLSAGIALVGNPKLVFLDEPTTGLDPASRRQLWTILERARTGRALILTTHSMDEAEVLSDRIGIMALGTLRCIGTPQHLKNTVGNVYHLKINYGAHDKERAEGYVTREFPTAQMVRNFKSTSEYYIKQNEIQVSTAFRKMENPSVENGIIDWGFSQVGLEEVFQMIVEDSHKND